MKFDQFSFKPFSREIVYNHSHIHTHMYVCVYIYIYIYIYIYTHTYICVYIYIPHMAGRPARTYIQRLCEDTGYSPEDLPEAMNEREKWRERVKDICASGTT